MGPVIATAITSNILAVSNYFEFPIIGYILRIPYTVYGSTILYNPYIINALSRANADFSQLDPYYLTSIPKHLGIESIKPLAEAGANLTEDQLKLIIEEQIISSEEVLENTISSNTTQIL